MSDEDAQEPRHGCLRVVIVALFVVVAAITAGALLLDVFHSPAVHLARKPSVVGRTPPVGVPPDVVPISLRVRLRVSASIVRVSGTACDELQQGTGFVVRGGYIVTDAHVVAGERSTTVIDHRGRRLAATVVRFDGVRDLALLRLDEHLLFDLPPLELAEAEAPADLAVFGHPGGGTLRVAAARLSPSGLVDAISRDIYGHDVPGTRRLVALAARLAPGDSGAPVVDSAGRAVAVAFAIDPNGKPIAYVLEAPEVETVLAPDDAPLTAVSTGPCIAV